MSAFLFILGLLLFAGGSFGLYLGLYVGKNAKGEFISGAGVFADKARTALSKYISDPKAVLVAVGACLAVIGAVLVVWGFIRYKREKKPRRRFDIHVLSVLAMLLAMMVMLDRFPGLSIKSPALNIGFAFLPPMLAAMLYGPVEAAIVYALGDLVGALLFPFGTYHPGFTVCAGIMGFIMGLFLNKRPFAFAGSQKEWKSIRFFPNMIVPVVVNCLVIGLFVNTVWISQLYGSKTYWGWFVSRLVEYAVLVPVQLILIPIMLRLCATLKKAGLAQDKRSVSQERLRAISRNESILGLERITELMRLMGDPQDKLRIVHVAGTNGKGSFTAMLSSILAEAGYKVGSFTSPAVSGATDSFRINCVRIREARLAELYSEIAPFTEKMKEKPTEFEVMTAAAFRLFEEEGCDIAVVECGLGGRGDSTNVIKSPLLSVITNVQLDHTGRLGATLAEIASQKAGIIKNGRPVLWGGEEGEALEVIRAEAQKHSAPLTCVDRSRLTVGESSIEGTEIEFSGFGALTLSLAGEYQPENAANVLTAVELLRSLGINADDAAVRRGLAMAEWPARFEPIMLNPTVVFDGAHNPDGVALAAKSIKRVFGGQKAVLLMSVMADKDYLRYPGLLKDCAEKVFTVAPDNPRALPAGSLAEAFNNGGVPAEASEVFAEGVEKAFVFAEKNSLPLIAMGTLYMYNDFKEALKGVSQK